jgi:hypothetical protein
LPGRSYAGDRQIHTPFPGGLCAVWAESLTRESIFDALRAKRCYGTTGARIVLRFSIGDAAMGGALTAREGLVGALEVSACGEIDRVEIVRNLESWLEFRGPDDQMQRSFDVPAEPAMYYLRIFQMDRQRAWSSPIWVE